MAKSHGGTTFCVASLCEAIAKAGARQSLVTVRAREGEEEQLPDSRLVKIQRVNGAHFSRLGISWCPSFRTAVRSYCRENGIEVIHSHGIWLHENFTAASVARQLGLPFIVSTHGMLEPWAWRYHAWKKRPVWWLWERRNLRSAAVLCATAEQEVESLRALGLRNPVAVIPNGVELPPLTRKSPKSSLNPGTRTALFVSRVHPKKGLLNLVGAWAKVRPIGWRMVVCGPDECGHRRVVEAAVASAGLSNLFEFRGPVFGEEKQDLYWGADLFILPTFSENFGVVIAEALASGVPAITTKGAPWRELHTHRCGWWADIGTQPLAAALSEAVSLSDSERFEMGLRGRALIEKRYTWPQIGSEMVSLYSWALHKGPQPPSVRLN